MKYFSKHPSKIFRRSYYQFDPREVSHIVGVPGLPNHLPEAEPILPGHTLIRPSLGMLKSAIKFPHQELEDGAGVYGNIDNLGIRYDAKNERVLNTGFRRSTSDYIMILPTKSERSQPRFQIASTVLDVDRQDFQNKLLTAIHKLNIPFNKGNFKIYIASVNPDEVSINSPVESVTNKVLTNNKYKDRYWGHIGHNEVYDERPKRFVPVHSKYLYNIREGSNYLTTKEILRKYQGLENHSTDSSEEITTTTVRPVIKDDKKSDKMKWFLSSKNSFDHITVNKNAPDHSEFIPGDTKEKLRQWWFFSQQDYKTFSEER
ncbi:uncharacterized protein LOC123700471 [Colias croceus]|uniref:uncharacterized protein LOC123700471 n=1 Tax=Colias crocea TaxID=72248 RepID=UPI001E27ED4C|nr:uncharacterized protein LOC123700471 [Colias croceus]